MIPKIIHYCWFTKDSSKPLPRVVQQSIDSWKKELPDYEIILWNQDNFPMEEHPWVKDCFKAGIGSYGYIVDYMRLHLLYYYGGIYLDADQLVTKSLDKFLNNKMFVGMINEGEIGWGLVGAEKHNPVIKHMLDSFKNRKYINPDNSLNVENSIYHSTRMLRNLVEFNPDCNITQYLNDLTIYSKDYFYPENIDTIKPYTHSVHLGLTSHYKTVSVVMPVKNGEKYLKESIDSVLNQTLSDFELLIVDDGSTDNTKKIIESYRDDRVVYLKSNGEGISEALNTSIRRAIGLYIARMDADDIMYPNRLALQVNYMKNNPHIDILASGFEWGNGKAVKEYFKFNGEVTKELLLGGNRIGHPTVMFRTKSIESLPFCYEKEFDGAEDYKLWFTALTHGLKIHSIGEPVLYYRQHENQASHKNSYNFGESIKQMYLKTNDSQDLTVIIPFQNEGIEIEKTVANIRRTTDSINIMLIDDCSYDGFNYENVANIYHCDFYRTPTNLGVAEARNFGVNKCKTPFFILLDGHMRFWDYNWHHKVIKDLSYNPSRLLTSNTIVFSVDREGLYQNETLERGRTSFGTFGAKINMEEPGWEYTCKWDGKTPKHEGLLIPCECVLGAFYASTKVWWNHIHGLRGLIKYGLDEPLMSIKTQMAGGEVLIYKDWGVGHLYRDNNSYKVDVAQIHANQLFLIHLFAKEDKIEEYSNNLKKRIGDYQYQRALELLNLKVVKEERDYLNKIKIYECRY